MRRLAIRSTLAAKAQADQLVLVEELAFEVPKTKQAIAFLQELDAINHALDR